MGLCGKIWNGSRQPPGLENCQVGVFLAYVVPGGGRALIDRELYLPQAWTDDRDRCRRAGVPDDRDFAAKPERARQMIERAVDAGTPFGWVAADEVHGQNTPLRHRLEEHHVSAPLRQPAPLTPAGPRAWLIEQALAARSRDCHRSNTG